MKSGISSALWLIALERPNLSPLDAAIAVMGILCNECTDKRAFNKLRRAMGYLLYQKYQQEDSQGGDKWTSVKQ